MAKSSGIGDSLLVDGYDLSGDIGAVDSIIDRCNLLEVTGLDKGAIERIAGLADCEINFTAWFNDDTGAAHPVLKAPGTGDHRVQYLHGSAVGGAAVQMLGKQVDYAGTRGADGSLSMAVQVMGSDGTGIHWGRMLTAGKRTDTAATSGDTVDDGAATSAGASIQLQVTAFAGTDATVKIEDSANGSTWADLSGAAFTAITTAPTSETIAVTGTVRRYVRATTTTSGGFTSLTFTVVLSRG